MNYRQLARTTSLAALIVSPTIVLLAMQMPLWLPPKPAALKRIAYADFGPPWSYRGPASWDMPVEAIAPACEFALRCDDFGEIIRISIGADWSSTFSALTSPLRRHKPAAIPRQIHACKIVTAATQTRPDRI